MFCVKLLGFTPGARELFNQENHLALYQLPNGDKANESCTRRIHHITKRQPPISHLISLLVRDRTTSENALTCLRLFPVFSYCSIYVTDLLTFSQTMYRCSPTARLTSSWRLALISGMAQISTLSLALTGQNANKPRPTSPPHTYSADLCSCLFEYFSYRSSFSTGRRFWISTSVHVCQVTALHLHISPCKLWSQVS